MAKIKREHPRQMINGVRRTKDLKKWEVQVPSGQLNKNGNPAQKWVTVDGTEKDAQEYRAELLYKIKHNLYVNPTEATLEEYLYEYLDLHKPNIEETTYELYKMYIRVHISPVIGPYKLNKILPMTLKMFYKNRMETWREVKTKKGQINKYKPLSSNSIRKLHSFLHGAFNEAVLNNLILTNPTDKVEAPKKVKYIPQILDAENFFKLLDAVKGTYDEIYIMLAGGLGLRRGEVIGLRWKDLNEKDNTITIKQSITHFIKDVTKDPKNDSSFRTIAVPSYIMDVIHKFKTSKKVISISGQICDKYKPQAYSSHFKNLLKKHNIPVVRFHDLRHFKAIIMMSNGVPDKVAAEILGHSQVATLREIYQHVIDDMKRKEASMMNEFFQKRGQISQ